MNNITKSKGAYSVSVSQGRVAHEHDDRDYLPKNADRELLNRNIYVKRTDDYQSSFNYLFGDVIMEYNSKQKREDRKKSFDYYSDIENGKGPEKAIYEYVFQIGNSNDLGVTDSKFSIERWKKLKREGKFVSASKYVMQHLNQDPRRDELRKLLENEMRGLEDKYPKFKFWTIVGHDDEPGGTFHFHVAFTPVADGYKNGMAMRDSLSKALNQMGFVTDDEGLAIQKWQNEVKNSIENAMIDAGYERQNMNNVEAHLSVSQFKLKAKNEQLMAENDSLTEENERLSEKNRLLYHDNKYYEKCRENFERDEEEIKIRKKKLDDAEIELIYRDNMMHRERDELLEKMMNVERREESLLRLQAEIKKKEEELKAREAKISHWEKVEKVNDIPVKTPLMGRRLPKGYGE